jgi:membrane protease YdiL (CAAX protease family)
MSIYNWFWTITAAALAIAIAIVASKPRRILGPSRLSPGETYFDIFRIVGFALGTWGLCILGIGLVHQARLRVHHQAPDTPMSEAETVVYSGLSELIPLGAMLMATKTRPDGIRQTGFSPRRLPLGIVLGLFGIVIVLPLILLVNGATEWTLQHFGKAHPAHALLEVLKTHPAPWLRIADVISAGLIAPLAEEMFFRGLLQTLFRTLTGNSWLAIVFAGAAFAMVHSWWTWPQIFFLALCLGYAYERTGNLWVSVTMHASFNLSAIWMFTH